MAGKPQLSPSSCVVPGRDPSESASEAEDTKLMVLVKEGDQKAFKKLFEKYKKRVLGYMFSMTKDQKIAEDLSQDIFLKVYRFRESFGKDLKFSPWFWTIARNSALDHLRRKTEFLSQDGSSLDVENIQDTSETAEISLIEKVDESRVKKCIEGLTHSQRDALLLRTMAELPYEEIAQKMETSLSSVKSLINRAKQSLLKCLELSETL